MINTFGFLTNSSKNQLMAKRFNPEMKIEVQVFKNSFNSNRDDHPIDTAETPKKAEGCKCCAANSLAKKTS